MRNLIMGAIALFSLNCFALTYSPTKVFEEAKPGETKTIEISIYNDASKDLKNLEMVVAEYILKDNGLELDTKKIHENKEKNSQTLVPYVKLPNPDLILPSKKMTKVPIIVTIPKDFTGSGYFTYIIRAKKTNKSNVAQLRINLFGRVAINVKGTEKTVLKPKMVTVNSATNQVEVEFKNEGNTYADITGDIILMNSKNEAVGRLQLQNKLGTQSMAVFPSNTYTLVSFLGKEFNAADLKAMVSLKDEKRKYAVSEILPLTIKKVEEVKVKKSKKK